MDSTYWTGLDGLSNLFAGLPDDIVVFGIAALGILAVLAIKRLFI